MDAAHWVLPDRGSEMEYQGKQYHSTGKQGVRRDGTTEYEYECDGARIWISFDSQGAMHVRED